MQIKNGFQKRSIKTALYINNFIPLLFIVLVFTGSYYYYNSRLMKEREKDALRVLAEQLTSKLELEQAKMNNIALNISYSSKIKEDLGEYLELLSLPESDEKKLNSYRSASDMVRTIDDITGPFKTVPQINITLPEGKLLGSGIYDLVHPLSNDAQQRLSQYRWKEGALLYSGLHRDSLAEKINPELKKQYFISLYKTIYDNHHNPLSIIEIKQYSSILFRGFDRENEKLLVFNSKGVQIYPFTGAQGSLYSGLANRKNRNTAVDFRNPATGNSELIAITECMESGWIVLTITDGSSYLKPVYSFIAISSLVSLALLASGFMLSTILSRRITEPLQDLNNKICRLDWNILDQHSGNLHRISSLNEVNELHLSFQEMNQKLDSSLSALVTEKALQNQSRILALQAQMDPHFVYNMMATISIMAEEGETDEIIQTINHMSMILRYIADGSSLCALLENELDIVKNFIACIKIRYGDILGFRINIPENMMPLKIPRHSILPLIENAVKYGLETEPPWKITVTGTMDEHKWEISVSDTGPGFSEEKMEHLNKQIEECRTNRSKQLESHIDGMGLINLYSRLRIFYDESLIFRIENGTGKKGATVTIGGSNEPTREDHFLDC